MALIGTIRKNFWFVLILLGLALAAFVIMDAVSANNRGGLGAQQVLGEVAGKKIDLQEFQRTESALYGGSSDQYAAKEATWNYYVEKALIDKQSDELGLGVSGDEIMELQFGPNYSPIIRNNFRNPQTGQLDQQQLLDIKQQIESGNQLAPKFVNFWTEQQKQIRKSAKQSKISNLISKALFTPSFQVENNKLQNSKRVNFNYVKIPFDYVADADINVTDENISSYISNHRSDYYNDEETRVVNYIVMDVKPTSEDSLAIRNELNTLVSEFRRTDNDSLFAINNEGLLSPVYSSAKELNGSLVEYAPTMNVGDIYGPYENAGSYFAAKLIDKKVLPDSVEARHILVSTQDGSITKDQAWSKIDSIESVYKSRRTSFEDLANEYSDDPGSKSRGGDLGKFVQGRMVKAFNDAAFIDSKVGGLYKVATQYGVHLIEVTDKIYDNKDPKYKFAFIRNVIVPSQGTQDKLYDDINVLVGENQDLAALKAAVENNPNYSINSTAPLKANDYRLGNLGSGPESRDAIKWAFKHDKGSRSPSVFTYTDPVNYYNNKYVLVGVEDILPEGLPTASSMRSTLESLVRNELKGQKINSMISGSDLASIASQFGTTEENVSDVFVNKVNVAGLGNEPKVISRALNQDVNTTSAPIVGNTGVYVVKTMGKNDVPSPTSIPQQRKSMNSSLRASTNFNLLKSLKDMFKAEDNRATYF